MKFVVFICVFLIVVLIIISSDEVAKQVFNHMKVIENLDEIEEYDDCSYKENIVEHSECYIPCNEEDVEIDKINIIYLNKFKEVIRVKEKDFKLFDDLMKAQEHSSDLTILDYYELFVNKELQEAIDDCNESPHHEW